MIDPKRLRFGKGNGLVTVVTQDAHSGEVLMVAHADEAAIQKTLESGEMHYLSRTRGPWHKGATSGNVQRVVSLHVDCDGDAVLARVTPAGPACHRLTRSCFDDGAPTLAALSQTIEDRKQPALESSPPSYTAKLLANRNLRLKKLGEETAELITALCDHEPSRIAEEAADVFYHVLVAAAAEGVSLADIETVLERRRGAGGR